MFTRRRFLGSTAAIAAATCGVLPMVSRAESPITASAAGFSMPLESEPHERSFMQWPARAAIYGGRKELEEVQASIADIARAISRFEPVVVLGGEIHHEAARAALADGIELWPIATEDLWCRDTGPTFVVDGKGGIAVSELNFNGWGGKQGYKSTVDCAARCRTSGPRCV